MKLLYLASDIAVDGGHGGSTHVREVAECLASIGHEVHVLARGTGCGSAAYHPALRLPRPARFLNLFRARRLFRRIRPDVVIERYYNFGGEGTWATRGTSVPLVLEVNAPMIEYAGSPKEKLDGWLLGLRPMERYRLWQARHAALIITPLPAIVPAAVDRARVVRLPWGANTTMFTPSNGVREEARRRLGIPLNATVALFSGSFRRWHGATVLTRVACSLMEKEIPDLHVLLVGEGETRQSAMQHASRHAPPGRFHATGRVPYDAVPGYMAAADFAVAPFETSEHPHLSLGFYWSPLKVFEAMAMELPVVTIDRPELREIVEGCGLFYPEGDDAALARAVCEIGRDPDRRRALGAEARRRASRYSWRAHCEALDARLRQLVMTRS